MGRFSETSLCVLGHYEAVDFITGGDIMRVSLWLIALLRG